MLGTATQTVSGNTGFRKSSRTSTHAVACTTRARTATPPAAAAAAAAAEAVVAAAPHQQPRSERDADAMSCGLANAERTAHDRRECRRQGVRQAIPLHVLNPSMRPKMGHMVEAARFTKPAGASLGLYHSPFFKRCCYEMVKLLLANGCCILTFKRTHCRCSSARRTRRRA
jgi:hypothetical protein